MNKFDPPAIVVQADADLKQHLRKPCSNALPVIGYDDVPNGYSIVGEPGETRGKTFQVVYCDGVRLGGQYSSHVVALSMAQAHAIRAGRCQRAPKQAPAPAMVQPGAASTADVVRPLHDDRCQQREIHEAADLFPLDEESIPDLADDVRRHGLIESIKTYEGKVLDGRRRLRACALAGVEPRFEEIVTDDPIAYAWSLNGPRRHLSKSELAMAGAKMRELYDKQAKERQKEGQERGRQSQKGIPVSLPETKADARDQAGKLVGVSGRTIDFATKILERGVPELVRMAEQGEVAVSAASAVATLPAPQQEAVVAAGAEGVRQAAKRARRRLPAVPDDDPQAAAARLGEKWHALLHDLCRLTNGVRDAGGIEALAAGWSAAARQKNLAELRRLAGVLTGWAVHLEGEGEACPCPART
jgi:hypothetical protein